MDNHFYGCKIITFTGSTSTPVLPNLYIATANPIWITDIANPFCQCILTLH